METSFVVNNVLPCHLCKRNAVIRCKGCWCDPGELPEGRTEMVYVTFTRCWGCTKEEGEIAHPDDPAEWQMVSVDALSQEYGDVESQIHAAFGEGAVFHTWSETDVPGGPVTTVAGTLPDLKLQFVDINHILSRLLPRKTVGSISEMARINPFQRFTPAVQDFVGEGTGPDVIEGVMPTPFTVNSILLCPRCKRNVVFTGEVSVHPLGKRVFVNEELTEIFFVGCKTCRTVCGDPDLIVDVGSMLLFDRTTMQTIRQHFPTRPRVANLVGNPAHDPTRSVDGRVQILHRDVLVNALRWTCVSWSLVDGTRSDVVENFV